MKRIAIIKLLASGFWLWFVFTGFFIVLRLLLHPIQSPANITTTYLHYITDLLRLNPGYSDATHLSSGWLLLPALLYTVILIGIQLPGWLGIHYIKSQQPVGLRRIVPQIMISIGYALSLIPVIEIVLNIPGIGSLLITSIRIRDFNTAQGCFLLLGLMILLDNLILSIAQYTITKKQFPGDDNSTEDPKTTPAPTPTNT